MMLEMAESQSKQDISNQLVLCGFTIILTITKCLP